MRLYILTAMKLSWAMVMIEFMKKSERFFLICGIVIFATIMLGGCSNNSHYKQNGNPKDSTVRLNRNVEIGFQGIMLGTPNKNISTVLDSLPNVTQEEIPYEKQSWYEDANPWFYKNKYEHMTATFKSEIIDVAKNSHSGYGMVFSIGDSVTKIVFTMPETNNPKGLFSRLLPLFTKKYGKPDKYYATAVRSYLQNIGAVWIFDNKQRISLNRCVFNGEEMDNTYYYDPDFEPMMRTLQRVQIIYQDMNAFDRKKAEENEVVQKRRAAQKSAQKAEKIENTGKLKTQQL